MAGGGAGGALSAEIGEPDGVQPKRAEARKSTMAERIIMTAAFSNERAAALEPTKASSEPHEAPPSPQ
jgi:hypothetical protein